MSRKAFKSLKAQLRKNGLDIIEEVTANNVNSNINHPRIYTIHSLKAGMNNIEVARKLYSAGETQKYNAKRRLLLLKEDRARNRKPKLKVKLNVATMRVIDGKKNDGSTSRIKSKGSSSPSSTARVGLGLKRMKSS